MIDNKTLAFDPNQPEVMFKLGWRSYAADLWSLGCVIVELII